MVELPTGHPLDGVTVVEMPGLATAYCGKLLANLGAAVLKLEPPSGDPVRAYRSPAEQGTLRTGAAFWYNNLGKSGLTFDIAAPHGQEQLHRLLITADVLLADHQAVGLDLDALQRAHPGLIVTVVSPFGLTGPFRDYASSDFTMLASGGQLFLTGYPDRRPLRYGGFQGYKQGSIHAAYGTLLALVERGRSGRGQVVDVSMQECVANSLQTTMQMYDLTGEVRKRVGSRLVACKDGYVRNMGVARGWRALVDWLDADGFSHDLNDALAGIGPSERLSFELMAHIDATLDRFFAGKTKREILHEALQRGIALTPVHTARDVLRMPELEERDFWTFVRDDETGAEVRVPRGPFRMQPAALRPPTPPPAEGSSAAPATAPASPHHAAAVGPATTAPPLDGVVVLDFTWFGAGAMATRVLAHFGATVVKVESMQRIDGIRLGGPFRGEPGINKSGFFNNFNSGKFGIALNMLTPAARAVAERLVAQADVIADNFSPGVLASFGLSDAAIHAINPRAVIAHMPMGGTTGELRKAVGFGATIEAVAGLVYLMGDPDRPPVGTEVNYPDYGSNPYHAASAILAGLLARWRTGQGQVIELSQVESTISFVGEALVEAQRTGEVPGRTGNVCAEGVFNEVLRCAGSDEWCAVTCRDDRQRALLLELAGVPASVLTDLAPLATAEHHRALAERLSAWSGGIGKYALAQVLQSHGIAAYPAINARDLLESDPQLRERGHHRVLEHPEAGLITFDGPSVRLSRTPGGIARPSPCLGQHTEQILRDLLALDDGEMAALHEAGALV
jgi:crotonobetainyl-CoA:carnitine CoA-transferase CaiB-like acyl-CoA transferase